jgi:hypothetical protein
MRWNLFGLLAPALTLAIVLSSGCGGDKKGSETKSSSDLRGSAGDGGAKGGGAKKAVEGKGRGTLKGTIVYDGTPPDMTAANADMVTKQKTKPECLVGASEEDKAAFQWRVNPQNKGVQNVIVWLAPGENAYFKLNDADKKSAPEKVVIDQPHCAFTPHCAAAFTVFYDGSKFVQTGQKVVFKNGSKGIAHNSNYKGVRIGGSNNLLQPGEEFTADIKRPDEITLSCEIHTWMRAYIRNFDHPFAAVTDENGHYEIKNVPTGVPVQLVIWHEVAEYGENGSKGKTVTLKDGENVEDFKIKAK